MEQIKPNKKAQESAKQQCYEDALKELKRCADKGIDRPTVRFWAPSFIIGHNVHEMLEKHGVTCVERGMGSDRRSDGSYDFRITYEFN